MDITSVPGGIELDRIATRQEFAAALTAVRESAGLTVRGVARAAGINASTIGGYYSGRHLPALRPDGGIRAVLRACGVTDPAELDAWQRTLARIRRPPGPRPAATPPPWPGLRPYGPADADLFHGRDDDVHRLLRLVAAGHAAGRITVVIGDPGTGKSSLLGAGLVPRLRAVPGDRPVAVLTPGRHPMLTLATALAKLAGGEPQAVLRGLLRSTATARELLAAAGAGPGTDNAGDHPDGPDGRGAPEAQRYPVLVVDQLEELFVLGADDDEQQAFVSTLAAACRLGRGGRPAPGAVVVALRTGFLAQAARHPDLRDRLCQPSEPAEPAGTAVVRPPTPEQVRAAVTGPARRRGIVVEAGLLDRIVADAASVTAPMLPRLNHTLATIWLQGQRARLTHAAYQDLGGLSDAVATSAAAAWRDLPPTQRAAAQALLTGLLVATPGGVIAGPATPHPATAAAGNGASAAADPDAIADAADAVRALIRAGLLMAGPDGLRAASGCLAQLWPKLAGWLDSPQAPTAGAPPTADAPPTAGAPSRTEPAAPSPAARQPAPEWLLVGVLASLLLLAGVALTRWG